MPRPAFLYYIYFLSICCQIMPSAITLLYLFSASLLPGWAQACCPLLYFIYFQARPRPAVLSYFRLGPGLQSSTISIIRLGPCLLSSTISIFRLGPGLLSSTKSISRLGPGLLSSTISIFRLGPGLLAYISLHAYGQSWLTPWGYKTERYRCLDLLWYHGSVCRADNHPVW